MVKGHNQEEHKKQNIQQGAKTLDAKDQAKKEDNKGRNAGMDDSGNTKGKNALK